MPAVTPQGNRAQRRWARTQRDRLRRLGGTWVGADVAYLADARGAVWWSGPGYYRLQDGEPVELLGEAWDEAGRAVTALRRGELGPIRVPDGVQESVASVVATVVGAVVGGAAKR